MEVPGVSGELLRENFLTVTVPGDTSAAKPVQAVLDEYWRPLEAKGAVRPAVISSTLVDLADAGSGSPAPRLVWIVVYHAGGLATPVGGPGMTIPPQPVLTDMGVFQADTGTFLGEYQQS